MTNLKDSESNTELPTKFTVKQLNEFRKSYIDTGCLQFRYGVERTTEEILRNE